MTPIGTVIPSRKWTIPDGYLGAGIAESDFGTAPAVTAALSEQIAHGTLGYCPDALADLVRERASWYLSARFGWETDPHSIDLLPDVVSGYARALRTLLQPGEKVIIPTPAYTPFLRVPASCERETLLIPMEETQGRWVPDPAALDRAFAQGGKLLVLCNPQNPTGTVLTRAELAQIEQVVEAHHGLVFADEIHSSVVYRPNTHIPYASLSEAAASHTVTAISASKGWNVAGLKCAQTVIPNPAIQDAFGAAAEISNGSQSVLGCVAAAAAYTPDGVAWLDHTVEILRHNRDTWAAAIAKLTPRFRTAAPQATYLSWVYAQPHNHTSAHEWVRAHARLWVNDGADSGPQYGDWFRLNFAMQPEQLTEAYRRLTAVS